MIKGIPVSEGYAIGKAYHYHDQQLDTSKRHIDQPSLEIVFFHDAIEKTVKQLDELIIKSSKDFGEETSKIFEAHRLIAQDPDLVKAVEKKITEESCNMLYALKSVSDSYVSMFEKLEDPYLKERSLDLVDVTKRMMRNALNLSSDQMVLPKREMILIADELTPSQIASIQLKYVKGIITKTGGKTSHSAIIAKLLGIPAIMGVDLVFEKTHHHQEIIMDAFIGEIYINFDYQIKSDYLYKTERFLSYKESLKSLVHRPSTSNDGQSYLLTGQIGSSKDVLHVIENGADGVGLFRTEFLFINRNNAPSEEEQYEEYKSVLLSMFPKPVIIRTIDIGGDKQTPYLKSHDELNPSLGLRAIRLSIYHQTLIYHQLKALLRASIHGHLKIMFPMVATIEEVYMIKQWIKDIQIEFDANDIKYAQFEIGVMIEIPSAALMANDFAKEVDFLSIGTNDLIQYTFAADRTNQALDYLYRPFSPAIIKLIHMTAKAAHEHHKSISVCGEMASDMLAMPLLLGLGINELSMTPTMILKAKEFVLSHSHQSFVDAANHILTLDSEKEILIHLKKQFQS